MNKWADVSFYTKLPVLGTHRLLWDMDMWAKRKFRQVSLAKATDRDW